MSEAIEMLLMGVTWQDVQSWLPGFWRGFIISLQVTAVSLLIGIPLGLVFALGVQARNKMIRWLCLALVEVGRGAPALVLLQFVYYGLPSAGLTLSAFIRSLKKSAARNGFSFAGRVIA